MLLERLRGVRDALGGDERWYDRFDLTLSGFRNSFLIALMTVPAAAIIAMSVERELALVAGGEARTIHWRAFVFVTMAFLLAFPFVAALSTQLAGRIERLPGWMIVRHWTLFFLIWAVAALFSLHLFGLVPYAWPNFVLFVTLFGLLAADIRLAQRVAGFNLGAAVLIGSIITSMGLSLVLISLLVYLES